MVSYDIEHRTWKHSIICLMSSKLSLIGGLCILKCYVAFIFVFFNCGFHLPKLLLVFLVVVRV